MPENLARHLESTILNAARTALDTLARVAADLSDPRQARLAAASILQFATRLAGGSTGNRRGSTSSPIDALLGSAASPALAGAPRHADRTASADRKQRASDCASARPLAQRSVRPRARSRDQREPSSLIAAAGAPP